MYSAECGLDDVAWPMPQATDERFAWLRWLLKCRADPNAEDHRGETALVKACNRQPSAQRDVLLTSRTLQHSLYDLCV